MGRCVGIYKLYCIVLYIHMWVSSVCEGWCVDIYKYLCVHTCIHIPHHIPPHLQNTKNTGLIGPQELALLPPDAIVVNVGRGNAVDEAALYAALREGKVGMYMVYVCVLYACVWRLKS